MLKSIYQLSRMTFGGVVCAVAFAQGTQIQQARAADLVDPTPIVEQDFTPTINPGAVDGYNGRIGAVGGSLDSNAIALFEGSFAMPMPFVRNFGIQADGMIGNYHAQINGDDYTGAAGGLHIFWRDPSAGMFGIYGDWGYIDPEHSGRVGAEAAIYGDRWSLEGLGAVQFGQHVNTRFVDEVDLSYYFTDNFKASVGHRKISRGHVGNVGMEWGSSVAGWEGWSVYGEAEAGSDDYWGAWAGVRFTLGTGASMKSTLMERDRSGFVRNRLPRIISSVTRCGKLPHKRRKTSWRGEMTTLCASKDRLDRRDADIEKLH